MQLITRSHQHHKLAILIDQLKQVLLLERQVLKRRVKRDFLDLRMAPTTSTQSSGVHLDSTYAPGGARTLAANRAPPKPANQAPRQQHQQAHLLRPAPPARLAQHQYTRPANQAPSAAYRAHLQQAPGLAGAPPSVRLASGGHRPASQLPVWSGQPDAAELLEVAASNVRPAPPKPLGANLSSPAAPAKPSAPFNDPSWPLLWYLVSHFRLGAARPSQGGRLATSGASPSRSRALADGVCLRVHCLWLFLV